MQIKQAKRILEENVHIHQWKIITLQPPPHPLSPSLPPLTHCVLIPTHSPLTVHWKLKFMTVYSWQQILLLLKEIRRSGIISDNMWNVPVKR